MSTAKVDSLKPHSLPMDKSTSRVLVVAAKFEESHSAAVLLIFAPNAKSPTEINLRGFCVVTLTDVALRRRF